MNNNQSGACSVSRAVQKHRKHSERLARVISECWEPLADCVVPASLQHKNVKTEIWKNNVVQVMVRAVPVKEWNMVVLWLSVKDLWKTEFVCRDWRLMQRVKNEVCGTEASALEVYPAQSRLVDAANQFHLWAFPPAIELPIGFTRRDVITTHAEAVREFPNCAQRDYGRLDEAADLLPSTDVWTRFGFPAAYALPSKK